MCGIAGLVVRGETARAEDVRHMCQTIVHRGPDDEGVYARGPASLGMRRLSIIDLAGGHQPIHNEDESVWVVFNGEIYNFHELRSELERKGHRFYTDSDTEVIVHLYEDLGADCVKKLRGMFAIALYDERKQSLLLARDRLGKKPLHYALDGDRLYFGSEIKTILAVAPHLAEVDNEGILQYFYFDYIPDPHTAYCKIRKLPPGWLLEYSKGSITQRQYWDLPEYGARGPDSEEECLEELERRLEEAVRIRLISDVPLGALLSGGVDSSLVVALMARASNAPVRTFSVGFENEKFNELPFARLVAERFGTEHYEFVVTPNVEETLGKLTHMMEEPFGDSSMIPTYHVSAMARRHVTVALAGDGGDELFAGYDRYLVNLDRQHFDRIPGWAGDLYRRHVYHRLPGGFRGQKLSWNLSLQTRDRYLDSVSYLPARHRERALFDRDFLERIEALSDPLDQFRKYYDEAPARDPLSRLLYLDTKTYLTADVLAKVDRMSMANSLEVRAPILDHVFVEWVTGLPAKWKLRDGVRKYALKKVAQRVGVPPELLHRKKQGFAIPLAQWLRTDLRETVQDVLLDSRARQRGYFDPRVVQRLVTEHLGGTRDRAGVLWQLLVFELWQRNFLGSLRADESGLGVKDGSLKGSAAAEWATRGPASGLVGAAKGSEEDGTSRESNHLQVVIVAPSMRQVGGQAVQAELLLKHWKYEPGVCATFVPIDPEFPAMLRWAGSVPLLRTIVRLPFYVRSLWRAMDGSDVAHVFSASYWSFWLAPVPAWLVARWRGKGVVLHYHSGEAQDHLERSWTARWMLRRMRHRAVPSSYLQDVFAKFGITTKVVPNVVDLSQFGFRSREPLQPVLLCTRGCEPYYAVDDVVRAFARVQDVHPEAALILVGGGSREGEVRSLVKELKLSNVEFCSKVPREAIGSYYDRADVFINGSVLDNMPVSILEAFAAGLPVVSTAPDGIRRLVDHERTGLLSPPRDWKALAENVLRLLNQPGLAQTLAKNGREQVSHYSWSAVRPHWLQLYREVRVDEEGKGATAAARVARQSVTPEIK